ncbi:MAG: hypothetical protein HC880_19835, partial [Bacteroidia bacterium]|nr:hypothetical protein [Bacteroidia bacterium]
MIITLVLASIVLVTIIAYQSNKNAIEKSYRESIQTIATLKAQKIENFFQKIKANIEFATRLNAVKQKIEQNINYKPASKTSPLPPDSTQPVNPSLV